MYREECIWLLYLCVRKYNKYKIMVYHYSEDGTCIVYSIQAQTHKLFLVKSFNMYTVHNAIELVLDL